MKIATSFKRIPAKNKVVLTNINYCKQKPDLLQVLLSELNILGNTSPIPTLMSFTHLAVRPRAAERRLPSSVFWARAGMGDNNSISGVEPIEPDKIFPPSRC